MLQQELADFGPVGLRSIMQGCPAEAAGGIDRRAPLQQEPNHGGLPAQGGEVQRLVAGGVPRRRLGGIALQDGSHGIRVSAQRQVVDRGGS